MDDVFDSDVFSHCARPEPLQVLLERSEGRVLFESESTVGGPPVGPPEDFPFRRTACRWCPVLRCESAVYSGRALFLVRLPAPGARDDEHCDLANPSAGVDKSNSQDTPARPRAERENYTSADSLLPGVSGAGGGHSRGSLGGARASWNREACLPA